MPYMENYFLQTSSDIQGSISEGVSDVIELLPPALPHTPFVTDLAIIMILASVVTLAFFRMKQPLIIGYLFAGMLIGPLSPLWGSLFGEQNPFSALFTDVGIVSDISALNLFAEIGIILLLFVIGIEFPYSKIKTLGKVSVGVGTIGLFSTLGGIFVVANFFGMNFMDSLFIAAALSISSTAVIIKILEDTGRIKRESSILILGVLIVEDVIAVILISSLQSIALVSTISIEGIIILVLVAAGLIVGTFTIGTRIIPQLIDRVAAAEHREILLLSVLGLCFGYALLANLVGLSVAIGAFLAGVLVAESKSAEVSKIISSPIKDMFVAIFFVSVGALMDIRQLQNYIVLAMALIAVSLAIKFGGNLFGNFIFRQERQNSMRSAFALASPRGEFSIVIVKAGIDIGAVSAFLFPLVGIISIITSFISPFLIKFGDKVVPQIKETKS